MKSRTEREPVANKENASYIYEYTVNITDSKNQFYQFVDYKRKNKKAEIKRKCRVIKPSSLNAVLNLEVEKT